ncbi:hypothetical protein GCM10025859_56270 [Alicyclobacillus fastidiosus]|nr:hypothetical protein GCM10025859_56270 [Alicyclobacillus fastidiosus]
MRASLYEYKSHDHVMIPGDIIDARTRAVRNMTDCRRRIQSILLTRAQLAHIGENRDLYHRAAHLLNLVGLCNLRVFRRLPNG